MTENLKHIFALILVIALLGGLYYIGKNGTLFKGQRQRAEEVRLETEQLKTDIIKPLNRLRSVELDTAFFSTPTYKALVDERVELDTPALERPNPFAPVE